MKLIAATFLLFLGKCVNAKQFTEEEYADCFDTVLCKKGGSHEFRTLLTMTGPKLQEKGFKWLAEIEGMHGAANTEEFWKSYPETKCAESDEMKREVYNFWIIKSVEHWTVECQGDPFGEECSKSEDAMVYMNKLIAEHFGNGDCETSAQKRAREEAEKLAAEVPPVEMPSFG